MRLSVGVRGRRGNNSSLAAFCGRSTRARGNHSMNTWRLSLRFTRLLLIVAACASLTAAARGAEAPTCAILPDPHSDVARDAAAILEAAVTNDKSVRLVERAAVQRVLEEQTLAAIASPSGVAD